MKKFTTILLTFFAFYGFAQDASVSGVVKDAQNNEPVSFANVIVKGTQIGGSTDIDGKFLIEGLEPGYIQLEVSFIGYKTKLSADVLVSKSRTPYIEVLLEVDNQMLDEVVVKADIFERKIEAPISMQSIGIKEIESNPGSNRDISRVIQSFPGVGSTPAFRNDVIIRGGGPSENRFFLDDVEIPILNHFSTQGASGGPVGIINADFIERVDFYSSSFPAIKYNALSGVLDFKLKEGSRTQNNYQFALGASEAALTMEGPIGDNSSFIFSLRRSYLQFLFKAIGLPFLPTFNDYQFKYKTNIDSKNELTIISLGAYDRLTLNTDIEDPDESQQFILAQVPVNNQWSYVFGAVYKNYFDNGFHTFVASRNMLNNEIYKYPDNIESRPRSFDYLSQEIENKFRYELKLNQGQFSYNLGTNLEYAKYNNNTTQQIIFNGNLVPIDYESHFDMVKFGFSGQISGKFLNERLTASFGLRADGNNYNESMSNVFNQLSPRVSASLALDSKSNLNMGLGRYYQQPAYTTFGFQDNNGDFVNKDNLKYIGMDQYNIGVDHRLTDDVFLSLEGFYKDYFQYPIDLTTGASLANQGADYSGVAGATAINSSGRGYAYGVEVLNRINFNDFNLLASYTYVRSMFTDLNGEYIPSAWDSKHLLTLTGTKDFKNNWRVGSKFRFVGGLPYTPYDLDKSKVIANWDARGQAYFDDSRLNTERGGNFYQLDLRIDKNFFFDTWSLMLYLDVQNALNFKYLNQDYIIRETNADGSFKTANNGTEYVLKTVPNESGTVLPTIGVIVKI
jgi:hypothetical protein